MRLSRLSLKGWTSIQACDLEFGPVNLVIGPNGAGKSNLVAFFQFLQELLQGRLQQYVARAGGASALLHFGPRKTSQIELLCFFESKDTGDNDSVSYLRIILAHAGTDTLIFTNESVGLWVQGAPDVSAVLLDFGHRESLIEQKAAQDPRAALVRDHLKALGVFHFHDTSPAARVRQSGYLEDNRNLLADAGNLAAMLYRYQQTRPAVYRQIVATVRMAFPAFGTFDLAPRELDKSSILLNWRQVDSDYLFGPHQLSDGTLRFLALTTLLLQPVADRPALIVLDEPELGLHPFALAILAEMIRAASTTSQLIVATQSADLVDHFEPHEVLVTDLVQGCSQFRRCDDQSLAGWLEDYSLGELWKKNVIGGGPTR